MKRRTWIVLLLVLLASATVTWLSGRAPTRYVLEGECRRYQRDRVREIQQFQQDAVRDGLAPNSREYHRRERALLDAHKRLEIRGWEVLLIPAGARRPEPRDFLKLDRFDPSQRLDPVQVQGGMEVWAAPRGRLARALHGLGLGP